MQNQDEKAAKKAATPRIKSRLKEPSSWASIGGMFLGSLSVVPKDNVELVLVMAFVCFGLGFFFREN